MKTNKLILIICAAALAVACSNSERELKMMSYSVNNCVGLDSLPDYQRVADIILSEKPNIVALQDLALKADAQTPDVLAELAGRTSMIASYGNKEADGNGIGLLSAEKPVSTRYVKLPGTQNEFGMLIADFKKFVFANVFMSGNSSDQIASVAIIKEEATKAGKPFFLGGNLNARISSPVVMGLVKDFTILTDISARTYPADNPVYLIDYIMMFNRNIKNFSVDSEATLNEPVASNHRPVVAKISFK